MSKPSATTFGMQITSDVYTCWEDRGKMIEAEKFVGFFVWFFGGVFFFPSERSCSGLEPFCV